jgi:hypothetical protein
MLFPNIFCYYLPYSQRAQRDPFSNPIHEKPDRDIRGLGFSSISQQPVGAGQVRSKSKGQDGIGGSYYTEVLVLLKSNLTDAATFMQIKILGLQDLIVLSLHFYQLLLVLLIGLVGCQLTKAGRTLRKKSTCGMIYILKEQIMELPVLQEKEN